MKCLSLLHVIALILISNFILFDTVALATRIRSHNKHKRTTAKVARRVNAETSTKATLSRRSKTKGLNINGIFNLVDKYRTFSKTKFGAFLNGIFLGVIDNVIKAKAAPNCTENKFWQVIECFVGGADATLDTYYAQIPNYKNSPDDAEKNVNEAEGEGEKIAKDKDVQTLDKQDKNPPEKESSWGSYLTKGWNYIKKTAKSVMDAVKTKLTGFYEKCEKFFNSPMIKGLIKVGKCVGPLAFKELKKGPVLDATLIFLGVPFAAQIKTIIMNAPMIWKTIKELFKKIKEAVTKKYSTPEQKYYNYGKVVGEAIYDLVKIVKHAKKLRRFRRIFRELSY